MYPTQPGQMVTWLLRQARSDLAHTACVRWQAPSSHQPVLSLRCCLMLHTRERHPGKERSPSLCPAEPELWQLPLLGQMPSHTYCRGPWSATVSPVKTRLSLAGLASPCWHPALARVPSPPITMFPAPSLVCPGICLAHGEETKVLLMPLGVAWFWPWLSQGHGMQGQPLWQVFAKPSR